MKIKPRVFRKSVAAAGTRERLTSSDIAVPGVTIQAVAGNTGNVYFGDETVVSTNSPFVAAGDSFTLRAVDFGLASANISLKDIWLDVDTNANAVNVIYMEQIEE